MDIQLFNSYESRSEIGVKAAGYIISFLLFINSFFGYWVSLDKDKFAPLVSDWSSLVAAIIIFYIVVELVSIVGFLSIVYTWPRYLHCAALLSFVLFIGGLTNVALRANGFAFFLLLSATIVYLVIGYHYQCLIACRTKEHHITCRGSCKRSEDVHGVDNQLGGFLSRNAAGLMTFLGAGVTAGATLDAQNSNRHVPFSNEADEEEEKEEGGVDRQTKIKSMGYEANGFQPSEVIATTSASSGSTLRMQQHRRQLSSSGGGTGLFDVKSIEESSHRRAPSTDSTKFAQLNAENLGN